ncbi:MAG: UMP kinase, partial [Candidatus Micrarchaeota archaeon]|nr:UMP kinase [Candidatus Micrarchaeota archaeon]
VLEGKAYKALPKTFDEAAQALESNDIVVMGGTLPGITTDTDAVLLGERVGSKRLVNVSNVDAIYTADPRKDRSARKIARMTHTELAMMAAQSDTRKAGENFVFDMLACKLLSRAGMEAHFVSGADLKGLENAIEGKKHGGTVVVPG